MYILLFSVCVRRRRSIGTRENKENVKNKLTSWYCFNCRKEAATGVRCYCYYLTAIQLLDHCWRVDNLVVHTLRLFRFFRFFVFTLSFFYTLVPRNRTLTHSQSVRCALSTFHLTFYYRLLSFEHLKIISFKITKLTTLTHYQQEMWRFNVLPMGNWLSFPYIYILTIEHESVFDRKFV